MNKILETNLLEFEKSNFLIDLVEHENGQLFIQIVQTIYGFSDIPKPIKINATILPDIINVLQKLEMKLPSNSKPQKGYISESDQQKIVSSYLKGVPIKDLCMRFSMSKNKIEMLLRNKQIAIVDNNLPKPRFRRWYRK